MLGIIVLIYKFHAVKPDSLLHALDFDSLFCDKKIIFKTL